jgi:hypothetical protein
MADAPGSLDAFARETRDMAQRLGMQIAGVRLEKREAAFAFAERTFRETALGLGVAAGQAHAFAELQMDVIRRTVIDIDVGGYPQGGNA